MTLTLLLRLLCISLLLVPAAYLFASLDSPPPFVTGLVSALLALGGVYIGDVLSALLQRKSEQETSETAAAEPEQRAAAPAEPQPVRNRWRGSGVIRWYGTDNYGFITSDEEGEEIFFHLNDMPRNQRDKIRPLLQEGQPVRFQARQTERGWRAQNLQIVEEDASGDAPTAEK